MRHDLDEGHALIAQLAQLAQLNEAVAAPVEADKWIQAYRCGCLLGFVRKIDAPAYCPHHKRAKSGEAAPIPSTARRRKGSR